MSKQKIVNRPPKEDRVTGTETQHEGPVASRSDLEERFAALADQWRREVAFSSSVNEMVEHPAYRSIIGMGPAVVPSFYGRCSRSRITGSGLSLPSPAKTRSGRRRPEIWIG